MISINKVLLAVAGLAAGVLLMAAGMAESRPQAEPSRAPELSATVAVAARFPTPEDMMVARLIVPAQSAVVFTRAAQRPAPVPASVRRPACVHEHWPYIADECLNNDDGVTAPRPIRTIAIERRFASN
jgi:hypothetical protein